MTQASYDQFHEIARFALASGPDGFPEGLRKHAAHLMLDTLGVAIASVHTDAGKIVRDAAVALHGTTDPDMQAPIMFDGRVASLAGAAFASASQIDNLDAHDGFNPVKGHIGVAVVPALFSIARHLPDLSGRDALDALIVGYEIAGRAGQALHASVSDYHTSGAWNALGVAALAARLRGMSADQLRHAMGIAEYHGPRSQMMREIANPTMLHDGSGMGALVGVSAVVMAELGFTGAPALTVEGPDVAHFWTTLGEVWQIEEQYIKPYPICRWAHAAIDAAREICAEHHLSHEDIVEIRIGSFANAVALFAGIPETTSQAQYSLAFAVASMIVHGRVGVHEIEPSAFKDTDVTRLVECTKLVVLERHEKSFPAKRSAEVSITLRGGRVLDSGYVDARGGIERPFTNDDIIAKFHEFAGEYLGENDARELQNKVLGLSKPGARFSELAALVAQPLNRNG